MQHYHKYIQVSFTHMQRFWKSSAWFFISCQLGRKKKHTHNTRACAHTHIRWKMSYLPSVSGAAVAARTSV